MSEITNFQATAATTALKAMFTKKHFSICDVDAIAETLGRKDLCAGRDYAALRSLHCMDWQDMPAGLPNQVRERVLSMLQIPPEVLEVVTRPVPDEKQAEEAAKPQGLRLAFWRKAA